MAYVDLNPIRVVKENDTFISNFTSIQQRLYDYTKSKKAHKRKSQDEKILIERVNHQRSIQENIES